MASSSGSSKYRSIWCSPEESRWLACWWPHALLFIQRPQLPRTHTDIYTHARTHIPKRASTHARTQPHTTTKVDRLTEGTKCDLTENYGSNLCLYCHPVVKHNTTTLNPKMSVIHHSIKTYQIHLYWASQFTYTRHTSHENRKHSMNTSKLKGCP